MSCSVIIRCYNEGRHIGRLLEGIIQQTIKNIEIIIVDSGSTDDTLAIASQYPVKILSIKPEEFSFGRSLNIGCQMATKELLVIASAHVYPVYQDWLEKLLFPFSNSEIALVYGKQRGDKNTKYSEHQIFAKWFPEQSNYNQNHPFCNNANAAIRRKLWTQLPYDENLSGLEDLDWGKKMLSLGYKIAYVSEAEIIHVHEETPPRIYNRYFREALAFKKIFPQEQFYFFDFLKLITTNIVSDYYHASHDGVLLENLQSIFIFRLMQFWGTYKGFAQQGVMTSELKRRFYYPRMLSRNPNNLKPKVEKTAIDYPILNREKSIEKIH